jgi:SOS-response transcriptional repressor LexA
MEPQFHDGDLIFVDPDATPTSGRSVVVHQEDAAGATFRQLIVEEGRQYLKALNSDWPNRITPIDGNAMVIGVVIFKGELL